MPVNRLRMLAYENLFRSMYMAKSHTFAKVKLRSSDFANVGLNSYSDTSFKASSGLLP